jgi:hypothetical protein
VTLIIHLFNQHRQNSDTRRTIWFYALSRRRVANQNLPIVVLLSMCAISWLPLLISVDKFELERVTSCVREELEYLQEKPFDAETAFSPPTTTTTTTTTNTNTNDNAETTNDTGVSAAGSFARALAFYSQNDLFQCVSRARQASRFCFPGPDGPTMLKSYANYWVCASFHA